LNSLRIPPVARIPLHLAVAREGCSGGELSPGETAQLLGFPFPRRREAWLRGRAALKRLLRALGLDPDTSLLRFPHPQFSITHSGGIAVAVGTRSTRLTGIGVDYETQAPSPGSTHHFLAPAEQAARRTPSELLRLWTIKEACFKADPGNSASRLPDYTVRGRAAWKGPARFACRSRRFRGGFLSIALLPKIERRDAAQ
jgi:4'-phosphopantetheinyl transferase EntD